MLVRKGKQGNPITFSPLVRAAPKTPVPHVPPVPPFLQERDMKLYHGTTERHLESIMADGLKPRGLDGVTNWDQTVESNPHTVYLTTAYAPFFAYSSTTVMDGLEGERWVVLEIDTDLLDDSLIVPDEDALEQVTRDGNDPENLGFPKEFYEWDMKERTIWFRSRLDEYSHVWRMSIEMLGTCGYMGEIPTSAITRVVAYDPRSNPSMTLAALDPCISIMNYQLCGEKYRALTRWFAGYPVGPEEAHADQWGYYPDEWKEQADKAFANTAGLERLQ